MTFWDTVGTVCLVLLVIALFVLLVVWVNEMNRY